METSAKYASIADTFTEHEYGDPGRYFRHRADIVVALGSPLAPGDRLLDLACADASFAPPLLARGIVYTGLDANEGMVAAARARVGDAAEIVAGDLLAYVPPRPVAATTIFRSLHFVGDRRAFFAHVAAYTERKLVFDANPRRLPLATLRAELAAAGLDRVETRPFFLPQHAALPAAAARALELLERSGPAARAVLSRRFNVIVAATRS
jgi:methyltransferase family protein